MPDWRAVIDPWFLWFCCSEDDTVFGSDQPARPGVGVDGEVETQTNFDHALDWHAADLQVWLN